MVYSYERGGGVGALTSKQAGINHACLMSNGMLMVSTPICCKLINLSNGHNIWNCENSHVGTRKDPTDEKKRREQKFLLVDKRNPESCFFATTHLGDLQYFDTKKGKFPLCSTSLHEMGIWSKNNKEEKIVVIDQSIKDPNLLFIGGSAGTTAIIDARFLAEWTTKKYYQNDSPYIGNSRRLQTNLVSLKENSNIDAVVHVFEPAAEGILSLAYKDAVGGTPALVMTTACDRKIRVYDASSVKGNGKQVVNGTEIGDSENLYKRECIDMIYTRMRINHLLSVKNADIYKGTDKGLTAKAGDKRALPSENSASSSKKSSS